MEENAPGFPRLMTIDGKEAAVFDVEGCLYAVGNVCPHRSGSLVRGKVEKVPGTAVPGTSQVLAVRCPIHGWLFDLKTGNCLTRPSTSIPTYSVFSQNGEIVLG